MENLTELLVGMDLPEQRKSDLRWLLRNLEIRNSQHPNCKAGIAAIERELRIVDRKGHRGL